MKEVEKRPKLRMMKEIVNLECELSCAVLCGVYVKEEKRGQC